MYKVKIFGERTRGALESELNEYFKNNTDINLIDIKYYIAEMPGGVMCHNAMVIYEVKE